MAELHVLVDFENVQPSFEELGNLVPGLTNMWLFHGPHQEKQAHALAASHGCVTQVPHAGKGKNALDFHLSFYLGYLAARHPNARLVVVANDKGYDSVLAHAGQLGFAAKRVGYPAQPVPVKKEAVKKAAVVPPVPVAQTVVAPVSSGSVAKKEPAKKKKAATKKAAAKKAPVATMPASSAPAKKVAAKKLPVNAPAKKPPVAKIAGEEKPTAFPVKAKPISTPAMVQPSQEARTLARIQTGFLNMGGKAPQKFKPFVRHVGALLGKDSTADQINAMVAQLQAAGAVRVAGDSVSYANR